MGNHARTGNKQECRRGIWSKNAKNSSKSGRMERKEGRLGGITETL